MDLTFFHILKIIFSVSKMKEKLNRVGECCCCWFYLVVGSALVPFVSSVAAVAIFSSRSKTH